MKKTLLLLFVFVATLAQAQLSFELDKTVSNVKATVKKLNEDVFVIVPVTSTNQRYIAQNLPSELKLDGLAICFNGEVGKIPPNVRMMGTPLRLTSIKISKKEAKRMKLKKRSYTFAVQEKPADQ